MIIVPHAPEPPGMKGKDLRRHTCATLLLSLIVVQNFPHLYESSLNLQKGPENEESTHTDSSTFSLPAPYVL
jgi:hypothetical protein